MKIEKGQCFTCRFTDEVKGYFFTGITEQVGNNTLYVICEMLPQEEIDLSSFWKMSERFFNENLANGKIELI